MKKSFMVHTATLGPVGNVKGCGTLATLLTLPVVYALHSITDHTWYTVITVCLVLISLYIVKHASKAYPGDHDPSAIVIDEVVGCFIAFYAVPLTVYTVCAGFVLFRIFDIFKPLGIDWLERCTSPWGIVLDDIAAAILANVIVRLLLV